MARGHDAGTRYINRELSWLDFNARVLDLAADATVPLLERIKFCSFFSLNLDEFFMVRVAGLEGLESAGMPVHSPDGRSAQQALTEIREPRRRARHAAGSPLGARPEAGARRSRDRGRQASRSAPTRSAPS